MNKVAITLPPATDRVAVARICEGIYEWCSWAQEHELIHPVTIVVTGGPPMTKSELLRTVLSFLPLQHAGGIRVSPAISGDGAPVNQGRTTAAAETAAVSMPKRDEVNAAV
jgi:hypothetical protein